MNEDSKLIRGWQADPQHVLQQSERRPDSNFEESRVPEYTLPDILTDVNGKAIANNEEWLANRPALIHQFAEHIYGHIPGPPEQLQFVTTMEDPKAMNGKAHLRVISIQSTQADRQHRFDLILFTPNDARQPVPVYLLLNNRAVTHTDPTRSQVSPFWPAEAVIERGYAIAAIQVNELSPDSAENYRDGVIQLFGESDQEDPAAWGTISAWSWGASRAIDCLTSLEEIDHAKIAVVGHSRGGKAALWTGACDERVALAVSNESGCMGAALSRRRYGETIAQINSRFAYWFCQNFKRYNDREDQLPVDQHQLIALLAPRAVYVGSADLDLWADPLGEYLGIAHASPAFELWAYSGLNPDAMPAIHQPVRECRQGYHIRAGGHNLIEYDWHRYLDMGDHIWNR